MKRRHERLMVAGRVYCSPRNTRENLGERVGTRGQVLWRLEQRASQSRRGHRAGRVSRCTPRHDAKRAVAEAYHSGA